MKKSDIQEFEVNQLLETILFRYGYDFRNYARASLERRILERLHFSGLRSISEMIPKVMYEPEFFDQFIKDMSVTVTEMFRDPPVYMNIRKEICTQLRTYSRLNIWHAGCATGEEVYSMAILLEEEGLLKRSRIYATDYNEHSLEVAAKGIYPAEKIKLYTNNYLASGGKASFADYYQAKYGSAKMKESLKENITFANHNLVKDHFFAQMHLIMCRNVLIYFDRQLQDRVLSLFKESLIHRGFLVLGEKESLEFSQEKNSFEAYSKKERIYRRLTHV